MTEEDIKNKNLVLIDYLNSIIDDYKIKAEYSTNDNDIKVIVVQETSGEKVVFYDNDNALFNYYNIEIFGDNIRDEKETSVIIGNLIGKSIIHTYTVKKNGQPESQYWQLIFKQIANPRTIEYMDIRRVAYTCTMKLIVNRVG
jgi:hypothetical protein